MPFYGLFMNIWATLFLEFWKRRQNYLAFRWCDDSEKLRFAFEPEIRVVSLMTGISEPDFPFLEAHQLMKDMYVAYVEGGGLRALSGWPEDKNPFNITAQDWLIGSGKATFKNLTSVMKIKETILLQNGKGANEGILKFAVDLKIEGLTDVIVSMDALNELDEKLRVDIVTESVTGSFSL
jgi:hypothetical protein